MPEIPSEPSLEQHCEELCGRFAKLLELTEDQAVLYGKVRLAIVEKSWVPLEQNLQRMEALAREQGRINKQTLDLRVRLQKQLPAAQLGRQELLQISELLPLLPVSEGQRLREVWQRLRSSLLRRQSELQVLQQYSQGRQELIEKFLAALQDDEQDCGQAYGRAGQFHSSAAPSRIFNGEA